MIQQQLIIDGQLADISEKTEVTLIHESNLLGGSTFTSNHSLTVSLPSTMHNRNIFGLPDIVQNTTGKAYTWHTVEYLRNGVPVISNGLCSLTKSTPDSIDIAIIFGMKRSVDLIMGSDKTLADIETDAAIQFNEVPTVTPYADAMSTNTEVFYAAMDTVRYLDDLDYYHMHVAFQNRSWDTNNLMEETSFLHPSVRMDWLLSKIEDENGIAIEFDDPDGEITTMIVPLVSKVPNDITFNGGYRAHVSEPSEWVGAQGGFVGFTTQNPSSIIKPQSLPNEISLVCQTAFNGLARFSIYMFIDDLVTLGYPVYRSKYGYRLDVSVNGRTTSCVIIPENTTFLAQEMDSQGRIGFTITGSLPVSLDVNQTMSMRITCISGGQANVNLYGGIHVYGGNLWVNNIIGKVNEVQPTQQYPVQGNLPNIKIVDLIKFLCAVTGAFPVQASTDDTLILRQVDELFDWTRSEDWSGRLLSPTDRSVAAETGYTPNGWAQRNWWRWKEDETVKGDYDGFIEVEDETAQGERDVMVFPFAATDGNNIPMYTTEHRWDSDTQAWNHTTKWNKVEPRVLHMQRRRGDNGAEAFFGFDVAQIIGKYYYNLAATMRHPVVITETVRMTDLQFMALDETKPIYLAQHGAYFALLSCELSQNTTAKVKLLKLTKQEEL